MGDVLRCITSRADEAERVALEQGSPWADQFVVPIEVRVVIHETRLGIGRVHRIPSRAVPAYTEYTSVIRGEHRRAARCENVDGVMTSRSIARFVEGVGELIGTDAGHRHRQPARSQIFDVRLCGT